MTHDHSHTAANYNRMFAVGIALNVGFVVAEAVFGVLAGSMALLADAGHNLSDVLGLLLAWGAIILRNNHRPSGGPTAYGGLQSWPPCSTPSYYSSPSVRSLGRL